MRVKVPGTAREIVECLIHRMQFSVKKIAEMLGITTKTVYRIKNGYCTHPKIHINLIQLYLSLHQEQLRNDYNTTTEV